LATTYLTVGTKVSVTGQLVGNKLVASNIYPDMLPVYTPPPPPVSGIITDTLYTETLTCGTTISTYMFQNDNGRVQQLRVANNVGGFGNQYLAPGSRIWVTNRIESFDGQVTDALSISQQGLY
jgi:hypothetical protein